MLFLANIFLFFVYTYGLGHALTRFLKENSSETTFFRIATGLAAFVLVSLLLNWLRIPLDWRIFLIVSLAAVIYDFPQSRRHSFSGKLRMPSRETVLVLAFFLVNLVIYSVGSFVYPWLEDDDSWAHAASIKYIALEKNLNVEKGLFQYLNPYPPGYGVIFGVLHQTHPSLYWTLKFFNAFIVSLGFPFFYFFVKEFSGSKIKAAWATFFLTCIPCYLSHFIWAHAIALTLFSPAFFATLKAQKDKRYIIPAAVIMSGIFLTQPTKGIKFLLLFGFLLLSLFIVRKVEGIKRPLIILALGLVLSLAWWAPQAMDYFQGEQRIVLRNDRLVSGNIREMDEGFRQQMFSPGGGSATRDYTWRDYFIAPEYNLINNPTGVGPVLCYLILLGLIYCVWKIKQAEPDQRVYCLTLVGWFGITVLGMNSKTFHLPVGLYAFRFWAVFALPACILAAEALVRIAQRINHIWHRRILLGFILISVLLSSGYYKFKVNTGLWPWGVYWHSPEEVRGYVWLRKNLPADTKVFAFTDNLFVIGNDMRADFWSEQYRKSFKGAFLFPAEKLSGLLNQDGFRYVIVDQRTISRFGVDAVNQRLENLRGSGSFRLRYYLKDAIWIFEVL